MNRAADLAVVRARLECVAPGRGPATALAVGDGRIVALGSDADVEARIGPGTRVIRLGGQTLLPGFQDAHVHPVYGGLTLRSCNLHGLPDQEAYLAALAAYAAG
ncbi:MAG TPA: amidohydrolase, partial [Candidatus Limnocylindria bacterium]